VTPGVTLTPFEKRIVTFLGVHETAGTRLKVYGLRARGGAPIEPALRRAALEQAQRYLTEPAPECAAGGFAWSGLESHRVGSLTIHPGREAVFLLLDVWVGENMLRHHVWVSGKGDETIFESLWPTDVAMCVWEMAILQHERAAWLRHVLTERGEGDIDGYLADVIEGEV